MPPENWNAIRGTRASLIGCGFAYWDGFKEDRTLAINRKPSRTFFQGSDCSFNDRIDEFEI